MIASESPTRSPPSRRAGVLLLLACATLWSLNGVVVKKADADPIVFAALRSLVAALVVLPVIPLLAGVRPRLLSPATIGAMLAHTLMVGFFIAAITRGTAAAGVILQYTGPAWVALIAWSIQRQKPDARTLAAIALTCFGVFVMLLFPLMREPTFDATGPTFGLLAGVAFGALIVLLEKVERQTKQTRGQANALWIVLINNAGTAILLLPLAIPRLELSPTQVWLIVFCGVVQHALPYLLFQLGLRRVTAIDASLLVLLEPILSPTWVFLVIGERPAVWDIAGGAAIFCALILVATKPAATTVVTSTAAIAE